MTVSKEESLKKNAITEILESDEYESFNLKIAIYISNFQFRCIA